MRKRLSSGLSSRLSDKKCKTVKHLCGTSMARPESVTQTRKKRLLHKRLLHKRLLHKRLLHKRMLHKRMLHKRVFKQAQAKRARCGKVAIFDQSV
jgi:hypothetical protein